MAAANQPLQIDQGASLCVPMKILSGKLPMDLTHWIGIGQIRQDATANSALIADLDVVVTDAIRGLMEIRLAASVTETIKTTGKRFDDVTHYAYDILIKNTITLHKKRIFNGDVTVSPAVTVDDE